MAATHPTTIGTRRGPADGQPVVLLVGSDAAALRALETVVRGERPGAVVEWLSSATDLVFRLAGGGVSMVLIDGAHIDDLSPSLFNPSLALAPRLRIGLVGGSPRFARGVALADLPGWLRAAPGVPT